MRVTTILLLAATAASAFLLPPEINKDDLKEIAADLQYLTEGIYKQSNDALDVRTLVQLACDGCYGNQKENGLLILDVDIPQPERKALIINGASMIPFGPNIALKVPMIKQDHSVLNYILLGRDDSLVEVNLGYDLSITEAMLGAHKAINLKIKVNSVDGREVRAGDADSMDMTLYKDERTGELVIMKLDVNREGPRAVEEDKFVCAGLFCHIREMMTAKLEEFREKAGAKLDTVKSKFGGKKGCHGKIGKPANLPDDFDMANHPHRRPYRPHHDKPHVMHNLSEGDNLGSSEQLTLFKIFRQVLFPIFVGVVAGMAVSLIGMIVGHFAVMAYQRIKGIVPRCPHARRRMQANKDASTLQDESMKGLLAAEERASEEQDAPPCYADVEESVDVVVVDSADEKQ